MRTKIVCHLLGKLLGVLAVSMAIPLAYAIVWREDICVWFLLSLVLTGGLGLLLSHFGENGGHNGHIGTREGYLIVASSWFLASVLGALPYWLSGWVSSYVDAVFETVSGFTTTGASIFSDVEVLPKSLLLWRSLTHWLGGMGIIVLFLIFLTNIGVGAVNLFKAESPGPTVDRVLPRIRLMAKELWKIYVVLTGMEIVLLFLGGMGFFDAVNHAFATMATGGFSTKNASIKYFDSLYLELVIVFFMFVAGGNFCLYYLVWSKGIKHLVRNIEFRFYLFIAVFSTLAVALLVCADKGVSFASGLRDALFTVVSIMTTTGFATADFDQWPPAAKIILFLLMFSGGCAGSTAGGIKVVRLLILFRNAVGSLLKAVHPNIVRTIKIDGKPVDFEVLNAVLQFFYLYMLVFFVSVLLVAATGTPPFDAMGAVAATLGNIGPGFGIVGPTSTYADVHPLAKIVLIADMLLGRLELITILVLFHPDFWQPYIDRRKSMFQTR